MKLIKFIYIIFLLFFLNCNENKIIVPVIKNGILNFENLSVQDKFLVRLDGEWEFYFGTLFTPEDFKNNEVEKKFAKFPSRWEEFGYSNNGYATYRLLIQNINSQSLLGIKLPHLNSSYELYINGNLLAYNGKVSKNPEEFIPQHLPQVKFFYAENGNVELVLLVANFSDNIGGIWDSLYLGDSETIHKLFFISVGREFFYLGFILIMSFYHFALYYFRKEIKAPLFFGFFCLVIAIRILTTGEKILLQVFPNFPWELHIKIEYLTVYFALPLFTFFLFYHFNYESKNLFLKNKKNFINFFKEEFYYPIVVFIFLFSLPFILITLFTNVKFYGDFIKYYQIFIVVVIIYLIYGIGLSLKKRKEGVIYSFIGSLIVLFTVINDILYSKGFFHTTYLIPFGIFIFIFFQSLSLALKFSNTFYQVESLSKRLTGLLRSFERFVPKEFLNFLNIKDITNIQLGDQTSTEMAILFADIRNFTKISEQLTPKENFEFVNLYLSYVGPVIKKNKGFIDKYLGDGFMALFPNSIENALDAAIEIQNQIKLFNEVILEKNLDPIRVGIGIHYGKVMLGVVGSSDRLETTVISDVVNTCSRLEKLNKDFGTDIIISDKVLKLIQNKENYKYRFLGTTILKGKTTSTKIYEVYNHYDLSIIELMEKLKEKFYLAISKYSKNMLEEALNLLEEVIQINPYDHPARYYHYLCRKLMNFRI